MHILTIIGQGYLSKHIVIDLRAIEKYENHDRISKLAPPSPESNRTLESAPFLTQKKR